MIKLMRSKLTIITVLCLFLLSSVMTHATVVLAKEDVKVKSIKVVTYPTKCAYNIGDSYSTEGMVVKATLTDGNTAIVNNSEITSFSGVTLTEGRPFEVAGTKSVKLTYKGVSTSYTIAVFDPAKKYTIKYNSNGGDAVKTVDIDASTKPFNLPTATKKNFTFLGWYGGNGVKYTQYIQGMGPNVELTAKWGTKIVFNANGGTGKMTATPMISKDYKLPKSGFKKANYNFVGWSTKKQATNDQEFYEVGDHSTLIDASKGNVTLYAQWVKPATYKITYGTAKNGKVPANAPKKYTAGVKTALPEAITKGEFMAMGWNIEKDGKKLGTFYEIPKYMTGNLKLTPEIYKFQG